MFIQQRFYSDIILVSLFHFRENICPHRAGFAKAGEALYDNIFGLDFRPLPVLVCLIERELHKILLVRPYKDTDNVSGCIIVKLHPVSYDHFKRIRCFRRGNR